MKTSWVISVKENDEGEAVIDLPEEFLNMVGWKEGDTIKWIDNGDGSWSMKKLETQYVLVETINTFRHRYVVEVPVGVDQYGNDKSLWALDTVDMEEAKEFSQKHLTETIFSHRVLSNREEILRLCDQDNDYTKTWSDDEKIEAFVTPWKE